MARVPQFQKKKPPEKPDGNSSAEFMLALQQMLQPVMDFHRPVEGAEDIDVRIFWDVRVVKGESESLAHVTGSSTMSGLLGPKMLGEASSMLIGEIDAKIAQPLAAKFQAMAEAEALDGLPELSPGEFRMLGEPQDSGTDLAREIEAEEDQAE